MRNLPFARTQSGATFKRAKRLTRCRELELGVEDEQAGPLQASRKLAHDLARRLVREGAAPEVVCQDYLDRGQATLGSRRPCAERDRPFRGERLDRW